VTFVCAHRGASAYHAENSLAAFAAAIAMGSDVIETDVRRTDAGEIVLAHDPLLPGAGAGLVRLAELVALAAGAIRLDVELKESGYEAEVLALLDPRPAGLLVTSFLPDALAAVRELDATIETGLLFEPWDPLDDLFARADAVGARVLGPHFSRIDDDLCRRARVVERPLLAWTVNEPRDLHGLLGDPAIACVVTDVPDVARSLRDERGAGARPRHGWGLWPDWSRGSIG
jgi:glycerophosphoryl diester phosphodiesterase